MQGRGRHPGQRGSTGSEYRPSYLEECRQRGSVQRSRPGRAVELESLGRALEGSSQSSS